MFNVTEESIFFPKWKHLNNVQQSAIDQKD